MFKFKDISSEKMGVIPVEEDFKKKAQKRYEETIINGKNGSSYSVTGINNVVSSFEIQILRDNLDDIFEWLDGEGIFEYDGRITKVIFYDIQEPQRVSGIKKLTLNYIRAPFWYKANDGFSHCSKFVNNNGNETSFPIIKIKGTGVATFSINNIRVSYSFDDDKEVVLDCENKTEIFNGKSKSRNIEIGFDYPYLKPGFNEIKKSSNEFDLFFMRKDVWK